MTTERQSGLGMHCSHDVKFGYVRDFEGQSDFIKATESPEEWERWLKLFKLIPVERLPIPLQAALDERDDAWVKGQEALSEWQEAQAERDRNLAFCFLALSEREEAWEKTQAECEKALAGWDRAWEKSLSECEKDAAEWQEAQAECERTQDERDRARAECERAQAECGRSQGEWDRAWDEWAEAWEKDRAKWQAVLAEHTPALEALHAELCPSCPGDGKTIFPERKG